MAHLTGLAMRRDEEKPHGEAEQTAMGVISPAQGS